MLAPAVQVRQARRRRGDQGRTESDYYHKGKHYLENFVGMFSTSRWCGSRRSTPPRGDGVSRPLPAAINDLKRDLGDKIKCRPTTGTPNEPRKPFDVVRAHSLNTELQKALNPPGESRVERFWGPSAFPTAVELVRLMRWHLVCALGVLLRRSVVRCFSFSPSISSPVGISPLRSARCVMAVRFFDVTTKSTEPQPIGPVAQ